MDRSGVPRDENIPRSEAHVKESIRRYFTDPLCSSSGLTSGILESFFETRLDWNDKLEAMSNNLWADFVSISLENISGICIGEFGSSPL